ncbi:MAG: DNA repair protein RecO [Chloroflexota bacterium]|nr:DNA repair protein RecO [Chloroflexota bacterium]
MSAPRTYKTEAIILKHIALGEADRIITIYTPNLGKIRAVAKGVRRIKSKMGGHLEPLTNCSLMLSRGRNLDIITQSQTIESFPPIRNDLRLTAWALYLIELIETFTSEHIENYPVYKLLLDCLQLMDKVSNSELLFRYFELQLLEYIGYRPQLKECINCKTPLQPVENFFSPSGGGILCPNCVNAEPLAQPITVDAIKVMRLAQQESYAQVSRLRISQELYEELERTLQDYIRYLSEWEIKSTAFLDRLEREGFLNQPQ